MEQFETVLASIRRTKRHPVKVWSDFCYMAAAISNAVDKRHAKAREERYLQIIRSYSKDDLQAFPQLIALTVEALERKPFQDFPGSQYMALGNGNKNAGQFFTPFSVCRVMAETAILETVGETIREKGYISVISA